MNTPFPLTGQLVLGDEAFRRVRDAISIATGIISLCTAYLRSEALLALTAKCKEGQRCRILARWQMVDLLSGASDLGAYELAQKQGWEFYVRLNFHGKCYSVPPETIVVGSANATLAGFDLRTEANIEVCTVVTTTPENMSLVDRLFEDSVRITPDLFDSIRRALAAVPKNGLCIGTWPKELERQMTSEQAPERLFVDEFFLTDASWLNGDRPTNNLASAHDAALLGFESADICRSASPELRQAAFRKTAAYAWLVAVLKSSGGTSFFGALSSALHSALLDNPAPRRREVKTLLQNLLAWIECLQLREFALDVPNHSQRLRLLDI
jgi:hypothetical protein